MCTASTVCKWFENFVDQALARARRFLHSVVKLSSTMSGKGAKGLSGALESQLSQSLHFDFPC